jgi:hypothetical protein
MGSVVQGVIRYRCPCGADYLVLLDSAGDDDWLAEITRVSRNLGAETIDGSRSQFACSRCGREHIREGDRLPSFATAD